MKRNLFVIILLSFVLILSGCGGTTVEESVPADTNTTTTEAEESPAPPTTENAPLVDQALLENFDGTMPDEYIMVQESTIESMGMDAEMSMTTTIKMTVMGDYSIMEMTSNMMPGTMVTIYNPDKKTTYQYTKGESFGMMFEDVEGSMNQMFDMEDNQMDVVDYEEINDVYGNNFTARQEMYKGQKAIYIETKEAVGDGATMKMWYSEEFFIPLKYEIYSNGELMMESEVTEFEANPGLSPADFEPPSDIEFQDMHMNMDFEMPEMPAVE